jgi:threonylcarbamoyladenosine tRNA methylthiotransferase MtaB
MKRVSFYTLGCRLNQAETAIIERSFEQNGYKIVDFGQPADVVVINTCTVTENGDADTRRLVNKANRLENQPQIALIGCQAQLQGKRLAQLPGVRWVVGNAVKMDLVNILGRQSGEEPQVLTPVIKRESFTIPIAGIDKRHTRANLKIQDGCDFFCSFCEIPYARGRARSREYADIMAEAEQLVAAGHKEIVLTGINIGTYSYQNRNIDDVLSGLEAIEGLERIRISSIEPTTISERLIERMAAKNKLCRYLHLPIQSGHDDILRAMLRKYTTEDFSTFIKQVHAKVDNICLGTDVIVGFPGETEEHFDTTYELVRELPFAYFHVFSYSDRHYSRSRRYAAKVPRQVIEQRSRQVRELSARKRRLFMQRNLGQVVPVLFEQRKNGCWSGLTDNYIRVKAAANFDLANRLVPVRLEKIDSQAVFGKIL